MKNQFLAAILSIVMPGVGQLYNRQFLKSLMILLIELFTNRLAHINSALLICMNGNYTKSLEMLNYDYAMFYPSFYILSVFDAVLCAKANPNMNGAIWFALSGLTGTIGIVYGKFIPIPLFSVGLVMIILMLVGTYVCSKSNHKRVE